MGKTVYKRSSRPPWKPERGQRVLGIPEPIGFVIACLVAVGLLLVAFSGAPWAHSILEYIAHHL